MSSPEVHSPVVLGRISGAWGVKGWVRIQPFGDDPDTWSRMPGLWIGQDGPAEGWKIFKLQELRAHGDGVVAQLEGVADRSGAEALAGKLVGAPREVLPATTADEYYWGDLIGLEVVNEEKVLIGRVTSLIETGANDVLVVSAADGSEKLLPFVDGVVLKVDMPGGRIDVAWGADW